MARKITVFELHFDGARFGPSFGSSEEADEELESIDVESEEESESGSSGSKLRPLLAIVGVVIAVTALRKLAARRGSEDYDIPLGEEESESVPAEQ